MKEITGELWDYYGRPKTVVCITTNGTIKRGGAAVMGRGCALEAKQRFPGIDYFLGAMLKKEGNELIHLHTSETEKACGVKYPIFTFPVKHNWWEPADLKLIENSAGRLWVFAAEEPENTYVLPRPGCGNGGLRWEQVKPVIEFLPDNVLVISKEAK